MEPTCPKVVIVEGNISAGKTTFCKQLADHLDYTLYLEPMVTNPFLEKYYVEPKVYALPMQLWLLKQRYITYVAAVKHVLEHAADTKGVILDRSIFSDVVFADKNHQDGNFDARCYDFYHTLRDKLLSRLPAPHVVVYLAASPETCYDRIHKLRQRDCEGGIPLSYLSGLDACYKSFLHAMSTTTPSTILQLPWNTFGDVAVAARQVADITPVQLRSWGGDLAALTAFVSDRSAVYAVLDVPDAPPEAAGWEADVADPEASTASEAVTSSAEGHAAPSTSPPGGDADNVPATKSEATDGDDSAVGSGSSAAATSSTAAPTGAAARGFSLRDALLLV